MRAGVWLKSRKKRVWRAGVGVEVESNLCVIKISTGQKKDKKSPCKKRVARRKTGKKSEY